MLGYTAHKEFFQGDITYTLLKESGSKTTTVSVRRAEDLYRSWYTRARRGDYGEDVCVSFRNRKGSIIEIFIVGNDFEVNNIFRGT